jgi:hypothetical protein
MFSMYQDLYQWNTLCTKRYIYIIGNCVLMLYMMYNIFIDRSILNPKEYKKLCRYYDKAPGNFTFVSAVNK